MVKIAFFDAKPYDKTFFIQENQEFGFEIDFFEPNLNSTTLSLAAGYDVVCVFVNDQITAPVLDRLEKEGVKLIALRCSGYNNVDLEAAEGRIKVVNVPRYSPYAVAEHAVALMLCLNRKIHIAYQRTRDNNFSLQGLLGFDMFGKSVGVVGTGGIGKEAARILKGFGMEVLLYDLYPDNTFAQSLGVRYVDLETIYAKCDIITLHCPLTPQSLHMINKNSMAMMKKGVMIINTGRGGLIHSADLVEALKEHQVGSAALDVYEEESGLFFRDFSDVFIADDILARLQTFPNVLITAHQAFFTKEALEMIAKTTLHNINSFFSGKREFHEVVYQRKKNV